ncbi:hypothetical protein ACQKCU_01565 [Heyndrickxia sporothermodurans]
MQHSAVDTILCRNVRTRTNLSKKLLIEVLSIGLALGGALSVGAVCNAKSYAFYG